MKQKFIYFLSVLVLGFLGCTDLTEEVVDSIPPENFPENEEQAAVSTLASYEALSYLMDDVGWWFLLQEITSDEMCAPRRGSHWLDGNKWLDAQYHAWTSEHDGVSGMYRETWIGIVKTNGLLDELRAGGVTDGEKPKIAELEAIRSFYYYILIDNYGDIPYLTTKIGVPERPLKLKRAAIYDSLVNTVERGLPYISNVYTPTMKTIATKEMSFALLAKLYLNHEVYTGTEDPISYDKVVVYCDSLINSPSLALEDSPLGAFINDNGGSKEIIFSIPFDEDTKQGFRLHMRSLHYQHQYTFDMEVGPWNGFAVTPPHFESYDETDLRKKGSFLWGEQYTITGEDLMVGTGKDAYHLIIDYNLPRINMPLDDGDYTEEEITDFGARIQKYSIPQGAKENLTINFPLFRLADFYLIKAEALLRKDGSSASVDELVNTIRARAGVEEWTGVTLEQILEERGRELFAEGHRRQDLIRFGLFNQPMWCKGDGTDKHDPGANAVENTFPIPQYAVDANPNLGLDSK
jgi:hypothetical protein